MGKSEQSGLLPLDTQTLLSRAKPCELGDRELLTFSRLSSFRNCQRIDYYRNNLKIVPINANDTAMRFGTLMHTAWEKYYNGEPVEKIIQEMGSELQDGNPTPNPENMQPESRKFYNLGSAIMRAYAGKYPIENSPFKAVATEFQFLGEIYSPFAKNRCRNRDFAIGGKVDGIVMDYATGHYYILEHKTATTIDRGYLDKLWSDSQIALYAVMIEQILGIKIAGIIYDIATKPGVRQKFGETDTEFEKRKMDAETEGKNPNRLKQAIAETDVDFCERLTEKLQEPGAFHREMIPIETFQKEKLTEELWHWIALLKKARKTGVYLRNTSQCYGLFGKMPCQYLDVCRSGDAQHVIESFYKQKGSHSELGGFVNDLEPGGDALEAF